MNILFLFLGEELPPSLVFFFFFFFLLLSLPFSDLPFHTVAVRMDCPLTSGIPPGFGTLSPNTVTTLSIKVGAKWSMLDRVYASSKNPRRILEYAKSKMEGELVEIKAVRSPFLFVCLFIFIFIYLFNFFFFVFPRLMVMGAAGVGKTTMLRRLRDGKHTSIPLSTDGVEMGEVKLNRFLFSLIFSFLSLFLFIILHLEELFWKLGILEVIESIV